MNSHAPTSCAESRIKQRRKLNKATSIIDSRKLNKATAIIDMYGGWTFHNSHDSVANGMKYTNFFCSRPLHVANSMKDKKVSRNRTLKSFI